MKTFLHYGVGYIKENYGIEALTRGTEVMLEKAFPGHVGYYICHRSIAEETSFIDPFKHTILIESNEKLPCLRSRIAWHLFHRHLFPELKLPHTLNTNIDCVLGIGGDLYTAPLKDRSNWPYPWPVIQGSDRLMKRGIPYVIWCASVGPFERFSYGQQKKIIDHLRRVNQIIVRETGSYAYLTEQCKLDNVTLAADPAFFLEPKSDPTLGIINKKRPVIAVNISRAMIEYVYGPSGTRSFIGKVIQIFDYLVRKLDVYLLLVPHTAADFGLLKDIHGQLDPSLQDQTSRLPDWYGAQRTKWAISRCNMLICMRFHCALAGISSNTPTILVSSADKGPRLFKDIFASNETEMLLDMRDFNSANLESKIQYSLANRPQILEVLTSANERMLRRADNAVHKLMELCN